MLKNFYSIVMVCKRIKNYQLKILRLLILGLVIVFVLQVGYSFQTNAREAIVYDFNTKQVLFSKNAHKRMYPASMTKIMVAYIVFQQLKSGALKLTDRFIVSKKASHTGGSSMFLWEGQTVTVKDLLDGLVTVSGNDAAVALAEGIAGSTNNFVSLMNTKAKILGMTDSHFMNVDGLPNRQHYTTVADLLRLSVALIKKYPAYYKQFFSLKSFRFNRVTQRNRNPLLWIGGIDADGIKTGHTQAAGYCLTGSLLSESGRRIIFVIAGLPSKLALQRSSLSISRYALYTWDDYSLLNNTILPIKIKVFGGVEDTVPVTTRPSPLVISLRKYMDSNVRLQTTFVPQVMAPVKKGQVLGQLLISIAGTNNKWTVPLIAAKTISKPFILFRGYYNLKEIISNLNN